MLTKTNVDLHFWVQDCGGILSKLTFVQTFALFGSNALLESNHKNEGREGKKEDLILG